MTDLKDRPKATHYTHIEGGEWICIERYDGLRIPHALGVIFAVKFKDGSIWDPISGWRETFKGDTSK